MKVEQEALKYIEEQESYAYINRRVNIFDLDLGEPITANKGNGIKEKVCPICKKMFCRTNYSNYIYKAMNKSSPLYFCSYNCMRKYEREGL